MTSTGTAAGVQHAIGSDGLFVLQLRDGDVRLVGVDRDDVRIRATGGTSLDRLVVERGERNLSVRAGGRVELAVELPSRATVVIDGTSTDIEATGLRGDQRYRTASGDLAIRDGGGTLAVEAVSGDVEVATVIPATMQVRTVSGDLAIRAAGIIGLRAVTTSGDVRLAGSFEGPGPFTLETVSGDAILAPTGAVRLEVRTIAGDIQHDLDARIEQVDGRRTIVIGDHGPTVLFRSMSGDLRVVRAEALAGARPPAGPVHPEPLDPASPPTAPGADASDQPDTAAEELSILEALERGDIDVAEADRRLSGPDATQQESNR
jgi:DUF4097 and DUF4098 domain-containing protein YvlB